MGDLADDLVMQPDDKAMTGVWANSSLLGYTQPIFVRLLRKGRADFELIGL